MQIVSNSRRFRDCRPSMRKIIAVSIGLLGMAASAAQAAWKESNDLYSWLTGTPSYVESGLTATATYTNQTATNIGSSSQHLGMYIGWNWLYDYAGNNTPLYWNNATQTFVGEHVSLKITRPGSPDQYLSLDDVVGDTWIGVPWAPASETKIATQADWDVPFFDFGTLAAGDSTIYDIAFSYTFDSAEALRNFSGMYVGGQGVAATVAEPATAALAGIALLAGGLARRRKK